MKPGNRPDLLGERLGKQPPAQLSGYTFATRIELDLWVGLGDALDGGHLPGVDHGLLEDIPRRPELLDDLVPLDLPLHHPVTPPL